MAGNTGRRMVVMDTDDLFHLLAEVDMGIGADASTLPDTAEVRDMRAKLVAEVTAIKAAGGTVEIPNELS